MTWHCGSVSKDIAYLISVPVVANDPKNNSRHGIAGGAAQGGGARRTGNGRSHLDAGSAGLGILASHGRRGAEQYHRGLKARLTPYKNKSFAAIIEPKRFGDLTILPQPVIESMRKQTKINHQRAQEILSKQAKA